jgi:outer membrane protein OmpA-like peptidoglycan-associated protein/outer membrane protein W
MQLRGALLAASLLALPIVASAQPVTGLYIGAGVGVNLMQDEQVKNTGGPKLGSDVGPAGVLSLGWGLGNGLRFELEGDFRANKFDSDSGVFGGKSAGGWEQKYGPMVNVLYDFVGLTPLVQPYVGVGAGYQWADEQNVAVYGPGGSANLANRTQGAFAAQGILGVAMPIPAAPGLAITAEYRFMALVGDRNYPTVFQPHSVHGSSTLDDDYNHTFLVGFRYNLGQTAAVAAAAATAAAPAPAVQPARSYLVFFDWDKATLTDRARQIIKEAADNSTHVQYTRIEVNGYTDTSGTPQYNMGLSIRRATAVKAELIKDGVPVGAIATQGFGETHLLVPTGAGVREPQNRRVEIIIH